MSGLRRIAVAQPSGERRKNHVDREKCGHQRAHPLVVPAVFLLDQRLRAGQNVAVDVVEQVERDQQYKGPHCGVEGSAR